MRLAWASPWYALQALWSLSDIFQFQILVQLKLIFVYLLGFNNWHLLQVWRAKIDNTKNKIGKYFEDKDSVCDEKR